MLKICIIHCCVLLWVTIISTRADITCQDPQYSCPDDTTCCMMKDGSWGCCPMPNAVCCEDKEHCCPEDTICDIQLLTCNRTDGTQLKMTSKRIFSKITPDLSNVPCGDGSTECPTGTTCCKLASGKWGCCPYKKAVCCSDKLHCCPEHTTCDVSSGMCVLEAVSIPWAKKLPSRPSNLGTTDIRCDDQTGCPDGTTCCKLRSGKWGCCPMPNAVCCNDGEHCCPEQTTCDAEEGKCVQRRTIRIPLMIVSKKLSDIVCGDKKTKCPSDATCCKMASGKWGCCPMERAVCCSDGIHCCPENTVCDEEQERCSANNQRSVPWVAKVPAQPRRFRRIGDVQCDDQTACPDGDTCCKMQSGEWGCCQMPNAVCCSDNVHCCPENTECDVTAGTCKLSGQIRRKLIEPARPKYWPDFFRSSLQSFTFSNQISKLPAFLLIDPPVPLKEPKMVTCPDGASQCLQEMSCCQTNDGYGCCPFNNGQCCSNKLYCCPSGTTCNGTVCQTNQGGKSIQFDASKLITIKSDPMNQCKNGIDSCPGNSKCCKTLFGGRYGCCPDPEGACCVDGTSCCPKGYVCKKNGQCGAVFQ